MLDGERALAGLQAEVSIDRDALGVVKIGGRSRLDVARACRVWMRRLNSIMR